MGLLHAIWQQSLGWVGPPVRLSLFAVLLLLAVTRAIPWALRRSGRLIQRRAAAALLLLTYPEYLLTSLIRRRGHPPPAQFFTYGAALGALERLLHGLGARMRYFGRWTPVLPARLMALVAVAITAYWYVGADLSAARGDGPLAVQAELAQFDYWLLTGGWTPSSATATTCR